MKNPYLLALTFATVAFVVLGIILLIMGANATDSYGLPDAAAGTGLVLAGSGLLGAGVLALLFALLLGGIRWVEAPARPTVAADNRRRGPAESASSKDLPDWP